MIEYRVVVDGSGEAPSVPFFEVRPTFLSFCLELSLVVHSLGVLEAYCLGGRLGVLAVHDVRRDLHRCAVIEAQFRAFTEDVLV